MGRVTLWAPLAAFVLVLAVVAYALIRPADRTVRSALVGKPLPALVLPATVAGHAGVTTAPTGRPRLINVFASWCVPCAAEARQLAALKAAGVAVEGVAIRDAPADTAAFLRRYGDPFAAIGDDRDGRFQLSIGSSGVPESFVIDTKGRIALQHVGPIMDDDVPTILAALRDAG
jgi:cytochrome c biogenesis protein CcmG, thiol:disulfide interchange protein DsbE